MKLYNLKEVAEMLGVSYLTVYNYARQGKIKTVRVGRFLRVTQEQVELIMKEGA
jgi:excisionase family DNA binding protein